MGTDIQETFRALADPTRRDILNMLSHEDMTIAQVAGHFDMTRAAVKKHLNVLEQGQLITVRTSGRERINRFHPEGFKPVFDWLGYFDGFWDDRLSALKNAIETKDTSDD
ncbi:ArsR/SmtB family transcription factor [Actibacterium lipolyticum]|uniref:Transcriptional repressor SdpR n=1 Tax=Actibacterium lipolyticum TaxID=1524263 RepID=A0A238JSG1_9RHOB|nr:metalloregulator ArsR/SmtB family transcription factor [Actibacterium lipolyticum]SMX33515.1 Transcriptional repressor SdpR [Actibacterium lipolyticum]